MTGIIALHVSARMAEEIRQWASDEISQWPRDTAYRDDLESLLAQLSTPANATNTAELERRLRRADEYEPLGHDGWDAADAIAALQAENERLQAELARMRDRLTSTEFLRPLIQEQSAGEWDDKTIDADVATFAAAIHAAFTDSQKETGE
ncbi:MAG: hypothetical protein FJX25_02405 [Alphaproteobacteria bacterium]|nr:hypothetical protein [Alphaproteobacteria bacterium]